MCNLLLMNNQGRLFKWRTFSVPSLIQGPLIPSADSCGCLHFFDEMFGGFKEMLYFCSVNGKSITLIVTLNYEDYGNNSELQKM